MIGVLLAALLLQAAAQAPYQCNPSLPKFLNWCAAQRRKPPAEK